MAGSSSRSAIDAETGAFTFHLGDGPVLGLGEGGPQFDRRGVGRSDAERTGRIPAADPRRPRARPLADRHGRLGDVRPSAGRYVRPDRSRGSVRPGRPVIRACRSTSSS